MKQIRIFLLCTMYYVLCTSSIHAQQVGLSITPPVTQILLAPNKKFIQTFSILNQGESGNFVASLHKVMPVGLDGHAEVDPKPLDLSSISIIPRLENADIELGKPFALEQAKALQLVVSLEGSSIADTEDTYLALVVQAESPEHSNTTITTPGISALLFVTLSGDNSIPVKLDVKDFEFPAFIDSGQTLQIKPVLENNSNIMIRPEGSLHILSPQGKEVYQTTIYNNLILGNSKRIIQGRNDTGSPSNIVWDPKLSSFGPHTLKLIIETTGKTKILEVERVLWILPIRILISLLLAIIISLLLIILKKRFHKQSPDINS